MADNTPNLHKQPTVEELEEENRKIIEELEKEPEPDPVPEETPEEKPDPEIIEEKPEEKPEEKEEEEEEAPEEKPTPEEKPEVTPTPEEKPVEQDPEEKFRNSTREAQVLAQTKKQMEEAIDEAQNMPEPTDEQMEEEYGPLEELTAFEKKIGRESLHRKLINNQIFSIRNSQKEAQSKIEERIKEIDAFAITPEVLKKFPRLEGNQEEFRKFATKSTRLTLDLEDAATIFTVNLPPPTKHKGAMFENGNGGPKDKVKPKSNKLSVEESQRLMVTNYDLYKQKLKAGQISDGLDEL